VAERESEAVRLARLEERQRATEDLLRPFGEISGQVIHAAADVANLRMEHQRFEKRLGDIALAFTAELKAAETRWEQAVQRVEQACSSVKTASIQGRYAVIAALVDGAMAILLKLVA
jgi:UDP-glucose 4-epimerase